MSFPSGRHLVLLGTLQLLVIWALAFVLASRADVAERDLGPPSIGPRLEAPAATAGAALGGASGAPVAPHGGSTLAAIAREREREARCSPPADACGSQRPRSLP